MIRLALMILLGVFATGCSRYYDHIIESDYSYDGKFNRYRSYTYAANPNFGGSEDHKLLIEEYLSQNLEFWGYKYDSKKPGLIVFYNLFLEDLNFKGYAQPEFEEWIRQNFDDDILFREDLSAEEEKERRKILQRREEKYDALRYSLKDGTLLISFYDPKRRQTVWQGYASGVLSTNNGINFDNDRIIRHIVGRIMHKYRILALKNS